MSKIYSGVTSKEHYVEVVLLQNPSEPAWTRVENNRMFWLASAAFKRLSDFGLFIHYPTYRADLCEASQLSWGAAVARVATLYRSPNTKTLFVALRALSWEHEGAAQSIGGDFALMSYRQQFEPDGRTWVNMATHELLHCFGCYDEQSDGTVPRACIMADLAQDTLCENSVRELIVSGAI